MSTMHYYPVYKRYDSSFWLHLPVFSLFRGGVCFLFEYLQHLRIFSLHGMAAICEKYCFLSYWISFCTTEQIYEFIGIYRTIISHSIVCDRMYINFCQYNGSPPRIIVEYSCNYRDIFQSRLYLLNPIKPEIEWIVSTTVTLVTTIAIIGRSPTSTTFSMYNDSQFNLNRGQPRQAS